MFDAVGVFARQFTPVDGEYLYYPSRKTGGRLVTAEEYDRLVADWRRVAGLAGMLKIAGVVALAEVLWTVLSQSLSLPEWADWLSAIPIVAIICAYLLRASFAPRRLVRDRPDAAPPRVAPEARRQARAAVGWPFVIMFLFLSGAAFVSAAIAPERTPSNWAWLFGSGLMFVAYLWIGALKLRDARD